MASSGLFPGPFSTGKGIAIMIDMKVVPLIAFADALRHCGASAVDRLAQACVWPKRWPAAY